MKTKISLSHLLDCFYNKLSNITPEKSEELAAKIDKFLKEHENNIIFDIE